MALVVFLDRGICKTYLQDHGFCTTVHGASGISMTVVSASPWFCEPRNKYSRGSCFPAHLQKPQLYRFTNPRHENAAMESSMDWEAVWEDLDSDANG